MKTKMALTAFISFAAGSFATADLMQLDRVRADADRVFELNIYHTLPGKAPELESLFRGDSKIMAKHGLDVIGFWAPNEDPAWSDTFMYLVAHRTREEAKKNWAELVADPESRVYIEAAKPLLQKLGTKFRVDEIYMRPTDFSTLR